VTDQVSHPYKTTGKIIVLYTLIFETFTHTKYKNRVEDDRIEETRRGKKERKRKRETGDKDKIKLQEESDRCA
jgi:hypothetical protein